MDGWIILDKASGLNSRTAGGRLARMFGAGTFGHIGTLDPMASGLLPIALGQATKMIPFIGVAGPKEYLFGVQFGFETDTLDITGTQTLQTGHVPTPDQVRGACAQLIGTINQIPPQYSAVHVNGQRAHAMARRGVVVDIPARLVTIESLELLDATGPSWQFRVICSTGTYVRSIARDIAKICGTVATVDMIRRLQSNGFFIKDTLKLDFLENMVNNGASIDEYLMPVDFGLGDIPVLNLNDEDTDLYKNGGFIKVTATGDLIRVYHGTDFVGIGKLDDGWLRPKRTLQ